MFVPSVFILGGLGMIYWFATRGAPVPGLGGVIPYIAAAGFIASGLHSFWSLRRRRVAAEEGRQLLEAHRDAPWRARPQWREPELVSEPLVDRSFLIFAVIWNLLTWPFAFLLLSAPQEGPAWLVLIFPLVGLAMLGKVFADYRRGRKFGRTTLVLDPLPPRLGNPFRGTLRTGKGGDAGFEKGILLKVSCYRQYVRRTRDSDGDRRRTVERDLLWRDEARIPVGSSVGGLDVPFSFELPEDQPPSNPLELDRRILWEVTAEADLPGLDFETAIEIPVFPPDPATLKERLVARRDERLAAAESSAVADPSSIADPPVSPDPGAGAGKGGDASKAWPFVGPVTEGIELVERPGSFELHFTAARNRKGAAVLGVSGLVMAVLGVVILAGTSFFWGVGLLALAVLVLYGSFQQGTNDTTLTIRDGQIEVVHDGLGMPADVAFPVTNLGSVEVHLGAGTGSNRGYTITLVTASTEGLEELEGQAYRTANVLSRIGVSENHPVMEAILDTADRPRILVANGLQDKEEADWLAYRIEEAAGGEAGGLGGGEVDE